MPYCCSCCGATVKIKDVFKTYTGMHANWLIDWFSAHKLITAIQPCGHKGKIKAWKDRNLNRY